MAANASRTEIEKVELQGAASGPRLLITAGVHGDEFEGMAAARWLIARFRGGGANGHLKAGRLTIVPLVNRAAFVRGMRTAEDHLDLARMCPGKADGSVTERTAHALSELIRAADYYIDLHSGGTQFVVMPMTGYMLHADPPVLEAQRAMARAFNLPIVWGTAPALDGRSLSVARDAGVPAIYAEYHGGGRCDPRGVDDYVAGCLNVMRMLEMIDGDLPVSRVEHVVEDPRPDSGHMQVCNPSPLAGLFEPAVTLGQRVEAGAVLGVVSDVAGNVQREIRAPHAGIVLTLRSFARVVQGASVGVVLEHPSPLAGEGGSRERTG